MRLGHLPGPAPSELDDSSQKLATTSSRIKDKLEGQTKRSEEASRKGEREEEKVELKETKEEPKQTSVDSDAAQYSYDAAFISPASVPTPAETASAIESNPDAAPHPASRPLPQVPEHEVTIEEVEAVSHTRALPRHWPMEGEDEEEEEHAERKEAPMQAESKQASRKQWIPPDQRRPVNVFDAWGRPLPSDAELTAAMEAHTIKARVSPQGRVQHVVQLPEPHAAPRSGWRGWFSTAKDTLKHVLQTGEFSRPPPPPTHYSPPFPPMPAQAAERPRDKLQRANPPPQQSVDIVSHAASVPLPIDESHEVSSSSSRTRPTDKQLLLVAGVS